MKSSKYYKLKYIDDCIMIKGTFIRNAPALNGVIKVYRDGVKHFISNNWYE